MATAIEYKEMNLVLAYCYGWITLGEYVELCSKLQQPNIDMKKYAVRRV